VQAKLVQHPFPQGLERSETAQPLPRAGALAGLHKEQIERNGRHFRARFAAAVRAIDRQRATPPANADAQLFGAVSARYAAFTDAAEQPIAIDLNDGANRPGCSSRLRV